MAKHFFAVKNIMRVWLWFTLVDRSEPKNRRIKWKRRIIFILKAPFQLTNSLEKHILTQKKWEKFTLQRVLFCAILWCQLPALREIKIQSKCEKRDHTNVTKIKITADGNEWYKRSAYITNYPPFCFARRLPWESLLSFVALDSVQSAMHNKTCKLKNCAKFLTSKALNYQSFCLSF